MLAYLYLGSRRSEVFRLAWEDIDFGNSRVRLFTRKRRDGSLEYDWLPMTGELTEALRWWWDNRTFPESEYVFLCEQDGGFCKEQYGKPFKERMQIMKRLCERAEVKAFGFHAIHRKRKKATPKCDLFQKLTPGTHPPRVSGEAIFTSLLESFGVPKGICAKIAPAKPLSTA